jgi:hypothetical protein
LAANAGQTARCSRDRGGKSVQHQNSPPGRR